MADHFLLHRVHAYRAQNEQQPKFVFFAEVILQSSSFWLRLHQMLNQEIENIRGQFSPSGNDIKWVAASLYSVSEPYLRLSGTKKISRLLDAEKYLWKLSSGCRNFERSILWWIVALFRRISSPEKPFPKLPSANNALKNSVYSTYLQYLRSESNAMNTIVPTEYGYKL